MTKGRSGLHGINCHQGEKTVSVLVGGLLKLRNGGKLNIPEIEEFGVTR